jgi:uncharacterized membrane protein
MEIHGVLFEIIELTAIALEILAVAYIVYAVISGSIRYLYRGLVKREQGDLISGYRANIAHGLLIGLEILIAADIVRTAALEFTMANMLILGVLVLIRTFLSWSLVVEIEGRWPWQPKQAGEEHKQ